MLTAVAQARRRLGHAGEAVIGPRRGHRPAADAGAGFPDRRPAPPS
jgi:hypothetical protein